MPETTPLIKAALNLRVGAGFDVYGILCPSFLCLVDGVEFYHLIFGRKKAGDLF